MTETVRDAPAGISSVTRKLAMAAASSVGPAHGSPVSTIAGCAGERPGPRKRPRRVSIFSGATEIAANAGPERKVLRGLVK